MLNLLSDANHNQIAVMREKHQHQRVTYFIYNFNFYESIKKLTTKLGRYDGAYIV